MINLLLLILIRFDGIELEFDTFEYDYGNVIIITTHIFKDGFE
jgi:hypothetical protein